jgi:hypothetical protein
MLQPSLHAGTNKIECDEGRESVLLIHPRCPIVKHSPPKKEMDPLEPELSWTYETEGMKPFKCCLKWPATTLKAITVMLGPGRYIVTQVHGHAAPRPQHRAATPSARDANCMVNMVF